jgi:hypothetical protein
VKYDPFDAQPVILSEEQRVYLEHWLRRQADRLGLRDWTIRMTAHAPNDDDAWAVSHVQDNTEESVVSVSKAFLSQDAEDQRHSLTHELLHCHFYPVTRMAERLWASELGRRTEAVIEQAVQITEERAVDRLARALAQLLEPVEMPV